MKEKIEQLFTKIDDLKNDLIDLSKIIHENPEIKWQEFKAVANIKSLLNMHDIELESIKDLPTAFTASIKGKYEGPTIAFLAEYDALPAIGHACGHNLIAMTNVGAFLSFLSLENEFVVKA